MKLRPKAGAAKKTTQPEGVSLVVPGAEAWEFWRESGGPATMVSSAEVPNRLGVSSGVCLGLPCQSFFSMPIWVPEVAETSPKELTALALERRGMLGAAPESAVWFQEPIRKEKGGGVDSQGAEAGRCLEATAVLVQPFEEKWILDQATRHEPTGRLFPAPAGGATAVLRKELGRWVADFYSQGKWLHSQPLLSKNLDASAKVELKALLGQWEAEGVLPPLGDMVVRCRKEEMPGLASFGDFGIPIRSEGAVPPRLPVPGWDLPPPALTERKLRSTQLKLQRKRWTGILTGYGVLLALAGIFFTVPFVRLKLAEAKLRSLAPEADRIRATAAVWHEGAAWLDPRRNALEILWQVSRPLIEADPPLIAGVRLTGFDLNGQRVLLQGEGKDLEAVEKYFGWIKKEPSLAGIRWATGSPKLLPNGNAQFQAEGAFPKLEEPETKGGEDASPESP